MYGARKVWCQLHREHIDVARCTVERLMCKIGLRDIVRGRRTRTTIPADISLTSSDRVQRRFVASRPNELWIHDFTYVARWNGFVYVAFVMSFARCIVDWRVSRSMQTDLVLDALKQAQHAHQASSGLINRSDRGAQYCRSVIAGVSGKQIEASVGSTDDSYENAMAERSLGYTKRRSSMRTARSAH